MTLIDSAAPLAPSEGPATALEVDDLRVEFQIGNEWVSVVRDVRLRVAAGRTVGLVGESGSGKTVSSLAVMGLVPSLGGRVSGSIRLHGQELLGMSDRQWRGLRADKISMVFQQALRSLNPAFSVGDQIAEVVRRHTGCTRKVAWGRAVELLDRVQIPNAEGRAHDHPHTFSGGMCQRVMIAMALSCEPEILIADEPTTALDVTVQAKVLDLLRELQADTNVGILFVTHDLGVIAEMCDDVVVMYAGEVVEQSPVDELLTKPEHPYTAGLLGSIPGVHRGRDMQYIPGTVPSADRLPVGCHFGPRCEHAQPGRCDVGRVGLSDLDGGRLSRCLRIGELDLLGVAVEDEGAV